MTRLDTPKGRANAPKGGARPSDQALAVPATPLRVDGPTGFDPSRTDPLTDLFELLNEEMAKDDPDARRDWEKY